MPETTETLAIKTGTVWTAVHVDSDAAQVTVASKHGGFECYSGLGERSIKAAAIDGAGCSYKSLTALVSEHPSAIRRRDLDC